MSLNLWEHPLALYPPSGRKVWNEPQPGEEYLFRPCQIFVGPKQTHHGRSPTKSNFFYTVFGDFIKTRRLFIKNALTPISILQVKKEKLTTSPCLHVYVSAICKIGRNQDWNRKSFFVFIYYTMKTVLLEIYRVSHETRQLVNSLKCLFP